MKFSEQLWQQNLDNFEAITHHPFNQELMLGTLSQERFKFYLMQDVLFMEDFARALACIARRLTDAAQQQMFWQFSYDTEKGEQAIVNGYLEGVHPTAKEMSPSCLEFTSFLLHNALLEPIEVAIAAILPCFTIYQRCGEYIKHHTECDNPYMPWINHYGSNEFAAKVDSVIDLFDNMATNASSDTTEMMSEAYCKCSRLEYHFWDDAYNLSLL